MGSSPSNNLIRKEGMEAFKTTGSRDADDLKGYLMGDKSWGDRVTRHIASQNQQTLSKP